MTTQPTLWRILVQRPGSAIAAGTLTVLQAACTILEVLLLERFVNGFSLSHWGRSLLLMGMLAGIYAFYYIQEPAQRYWSDRIRLQLREAFAPYTAEKAAHVSMAALEQPETQALLNRLADSPETRCVKGFSALLQIVGGGLSMAGVFVLIGRSVPWYLLVILALLGLMAAVFRLIGTCQVTLYRSRQEIGRRSEYLSGILFDRQLAQEKKLFGYTPYIQQLYQEETVQSGKRMLKSIFFVNAVQWAYDNLTYLFSASAYLLFLIPLHRGEMDFGLYLAIIPALTRLGSFFVQVGSAHLPAFQEYQACMADLKQLSELPEQSYRGADQTEPPPAFRELKGENLVFRYPGQEKPIIDGLNFTFQMGKNYALVGENGCGKSTLIKLLLGLYTPESGRITIDGTDLGDLDFGARQRYFSAVFQDFNRYDDTLRENLTLSDPGRQGDGSAMEQAAVEAQIDEWIRTLPQGYDTQLGNLEEGGVDLSGGQWQRLSIARMLYRRAGLYLWDEPTAAMDPLAESQLYTAFLKRRSPERANLFVTHRLGAAVSADWICVLDQGCFVEEGTHSQLMEKPGGLYRRMFEAQRGMYQ